MSITENIYNTNWSLPIQLDANKVIYCTKTPTSDLIALIRETGRNLRLL